MEYALSLAEKKLGLVYPNPAVGCVIVNDGNVVGVGVTANGGRPHAETQAITMAGDKTKGATAYVTLEPCAHIGQTPSCANELVNAGIARCVVAVIDADEKTNSKGIEILKSAGVEVEVGVCETQALLLNKGFFNKVKENRPMFTAKIATSIDGKTSLANGESKWITNELSRTYGHYLRANHDCIIVGTGTVKSDNPSLDCRINGMEWQSPVRIVLGNDIPKDSKVLTDGNETHVLFGDVNDIAQQLAQMGFTRCLIEGGSETISRFFNAGLVDRIALFNANSVIGGDGLSGIGGLGLTEMKNTPKYKLLFSKQLDCDTFRMFEKE